MPAAARPFANLQLGSHESVATITLDRPRALNALDPATLRELARAVREIRRDAGIRAVVLTGAGPKAFSAGADIAAMAEMEPHEGHAFSQLGHDVMGRIEALAVPVVAAVNGVALGGGLELALACDLIVASDGARFGQPEINLGLVPGFGGTQRLVRRIGQARTRDLVYLGRTLAAEGRCASVSSTAWCPPRSSRTPRPGSRPSWRARRRSRWRRRSARRPSRRTRISAPAVASRSRRSRPRSPPTTDGKA
jgi:1,4-dihydroxy-2-naphthoyl-CoA synthase